MAKNTAREIYVKKFLEPNPFLTGDGRPAARRQAGFVLARPARLRRSRRRRIHATLPAWTTDTRKHAVLASGGKDSLLSHGLLAEIGSESHPIFVNESGPPLVHRRQRASPLRG